MKNLYITKVWNYFLSKENKLKYAWVCFAKSIERGTLFIGFCLSLFIISYKYRLTNNFANAIFEYLLIYLAIIPIYGIFREVSFDYKSSIKNQN
jgi:hypothetical protein